MSLCHDPEGFRLSWLSVWARENAGRDQSCVCQPQQCLSRAVPCQEPPGLHRRRKEVTSHQGRAQLPRTQLGLPAIITSPPPSPLWTPLKHLPRVIASLAEFSSRFCPESSPPGGHISLGTVPSTAAPQADDAGEEGDT